MKRRLETMKSKCATCPFRDEGWTEVRELLEQLALTQATPICHSTGSTALVGHRKRASNRQLLCRGARDLQLMVFHRIGFIAAPTDEAWEEKRKELGV